MKESSRVSMVNISKKPEIMRTAVAKGRIKLRKETIEAIKEKRIKKGDIYTCAKLAGISAVKKTSDLIILAHPIPITYVNVSLKIDEKKSELESTVEVRSLGRTGVELEAIMGVMTTLLTIFDMCKYLEKDECGQYQVTCISDIKVVKKIKVV